MSRGKRLATNIAAWTSWAARLIATSTCPERARLWGCFSGSSTCMADLLLNLAFAEFLFLLLCAGTSRLEFLHHLRLGLALLSFGGFVPDGIKQGRLTDLEARRQLLV